LSVLCCQSERIVRQCFFAVAVNSVFLSKKFS